MCGEWNGGCSAKEVEVIFYFEQRDKAGKERRTAKRTEKVLG